MVNSNNSTDPVYSYIKAIVLVIVYLASLYEARAQVHLVKDISTKPQSSIAGSAVRQIGNGVYFSAYTNQNGVELWRSDGTEAGTVLVKDIYPGIRSSDPAHITVVGDILYFMADDGLHGIELWRSDGTADGTYLFHEFKESVDSPIVLGMATANDLLFINISTNNRSYLWKTDGVDMSPVVEMGTIAEMTGSGKLLFFSGDGSGDNELWRSDGTEEGTFVVKDISGSNVNTSPHDMIDVNGTLYFAGYTNSTGYEVWKTDGTDGGTMPVADVMPGVIGSAPNNFVVTNNKVYFKATHQSYGRELWVTDGTATTIVKDISDAVQSTEITEMIGINGSLYFVAKNYLGFELWRSDGTPDGTWPIADIAPGSIGSNPTGLTLVNGSLFFSAYDPEHGVELWKTDGTTEGTLLVNDIIEGPASSIPESLFAISNKLCFWANDGTHGSELWTSSPGVTKLVKDIATGTSQSELSSLIADDNTAWFAEASTGVWRTDGNTTNIRERSDFETNKTFLKTDRGLFFVMRAEDLQEEFIMMSDGTREAGPLQTHGFKSISWLKELNGVLYFAADQQGTGMELWKWNGTYDGMVLVTDIYPGSNGSFPSSPFEYNGTLYFRANDGTHGNELWRCEGGMAAGTTMVKDIYPGSSYGNPQEFVVNKGKIFFNASTDGYGQELWVSDGTESGTHMVKDIWPGPAWGNPLSLVNFNTDIYFIAQDGEHGFELWKSDGTSEGTLMIKDINPTPNEFGGYPDWLTVVNGSIYFSASDGEHGMELWKSNGTSEGTRMVKDLTPGPNGSDLYWFSNVNERLFFIEGGRLWRSNGTECSTVQITNDAVSFYDAIKPVGSGNKVYFAGVSADAGAELYYYDFSDIDAPGCIQTITFDEIGAKSVTDAPFELHATSSSGLPVSFSVPDTNVVAIEGTKVFIKAAGEVTITATVMASSDYTGTTTEQTIVIAAITGLEEDPGKLVSVYPNPTTDFLVVDGNAMSEGSTVNLLDINGRVLNSVENQTKVDLRDLPNGVYLVRVTTKDFVITKRIIKN